MRRPSSHWPVTRGALAQSRQSVSRADSANCPLPRPIRAPKSVPDTVFPSRRAECHDTYPALVYLTDKVRVIECRDRRQWILQCRRSVCPNRWRGVRSPAARGSCPTPSIRLAVSSCASRDAVALADVAASALAPSSSKFDGSLSRARVGVSDSVRSRWLPIVSSGYVAVMVSRLRQRALVTGPMDEDRGLTCAINWDDWHESLRSDLLRRAEAARRKCFIHQSFSGFGIFQSEESRRGDTAIFP